MAWGSWASPCHWTDFASPKMPETKSQRGRQKQRCPAATQDEIPGGWVFPTMVGLPANGLQPTQPLTRNEIPQRRLRPHQRLPLCENCPLVYEAYGLSSMGGRPEPLGHDYMQVLHPHSGCRGATRTFSPEMTLIWKLLEGGMCAP